jgi:hypothetical protein
MTVDNSLNAPSLLLQIEHNLPAGIAAKLKHKIKVTLKRWVTFRFLSPFFEAQLRGLSDQQVNDKIFQLTNSTESPNYAPYRIATNGLILNDNWVDYFRIHQYILRSFTKWHLVKFLQKNNPNVVGLTEKLEKPGVRDLKLARMFWTRYLANHNTNCIFSDVALSRKNFSLDHFIPWSYVAHDQIWNIIPTTRPVNSSKSDYLPSLPHYMQRFCALQFKALRYNIINGNLTILEDYFKLFKGNIDKLDFDEFSTKLEFEIISNYRIAENLGFNGGYVYKGPI